jgi:ankyrin repeat protein
MFFISFFFIVIIKNIIFLFFLGKTMSYPNIRIKGTPINEVKNSLMVGRYEEKYEDLGIVESKKQILNFFDPITKFDFDESEKMINEIQNNIAKLNFVFDEKKESEFRIYEHERKKKLELQKKLEICDNHGYSLFLRACRDGNTKFLEILLSEENISFIKLNRIEEVNGNNALIIAFLNDQLEVFKMLIPKNEPQKYKFDLHYRNFNKVSLFDLIIKDEGKSQVSQYILYESNLFKPYKKDY